MFLLVDDNLEVKERFSHIVRHSVVLDQTDSILLNLRATLPGGQIIPIRNFELLT